MPCWHWWVFAVLRVPLGGGKTKPRTRLAQPLLLQPLPPVLLRPVRLLQGLQVLQVGPPVARLPDRLP
jgi:hypothetical protein